MPKKKNDLDKSEIIRVRISTKERARCENARVSGAFKNEAESTFMGYLVQLGIAKYENIILPLEISDVIANPQKVKKIAK